MGFSYLIIGPNFELFPFIPKDMGLYILFAGEALIGAATVFVYIPIISEINFIMNYEHPEFTEEVNADISSALFISADALGTFLGPILGINYYILFFFK